MRLLKAFCHLENFLKKENKKMVIKILKNTRNYALKRDFVAIGIIRDNEGKGLPFFDTSIVVFNNKKESVRISI